MMGLAGAFARGGKRAALIPFVTAGFPRASDTGAVIRALAAAGADVIEVGVPFSDPMADGGAIQQANMTALANGMTLKKTLAQVKAATGGGAGGVGGDNSDGEKNLASTEVASAGDGKVAAGSSGASVGGVGEKDSAAGAVAGNGVSGGGVGNGKDGRGGGDAKDSVVSAGGVGSDEKAAMEAKAAGGGDDLGDGENDLASVKAMTGVGGDGRVNGGRGVGEKISASTEVEAGGAGAGADDNRSDGKNNLAGGDGGVGSGEKAVRDDGGGCPPVVLMGYANSFVNYGIEKFAADAADAGVAGVIVVDLDDAVRDEWRGVLSSAGVDLVNLIAPTTAEVRMRALAASSQGFVYYVTLRGITGANSIEPAAVADNIRRIRQYATVPVAAGFGIQTPAHAAALADEAQGVVVGSALVRVLSAAAADSAADSTTENLEKAVYDFIHPIAEALR